jgi:uncharacterized protein (DUF1330 family)
LLLPEPLAAEPAGDAVCEGPPVIMMVRGELEDRAQLRRYAEALQESGLYPKLGGYYLNAPVPLAVFEGEVPANESTLLVRFPCLAHARAFWFSRAYQEQVRPVRLQPSAGRFTVMVYPEIQVPPHMEGRVTPPDFTPVPDRQAVAAVPQVSTAPETAP